MSSKIFQNILSDEELGRRIRQAREASRFPSQVEFAARLGLTQGSLSKLERGRIRPKPDVLRQVARLAGCSLAELTAPPAPLQQTFPEGFPQTAAFGQAAGAVAGLVAVVPGAAAVLLRHLGVAWEEIGQLLPPGGRLPDLGRSAEGRRSVYSTHPERWDAWMARQCLPASFLREAFPRRHAAVLDVGCGAGHNTATLARLGYEASGVDADPRMIELARRHNPGLAERLTPGRLPGLGAVGGRPFEGVLCANVLQELPKDRIIPAVGDLAALVRPGGRLLLTVPTEKPAVGGRLSPPFFPLPEEGLQFVSDCQGLQFLGRHNFPDLPGRPAALLFQAA